MSIIRHVLNLEAVTTREGTSDIHAFIFRESNYRYRRVLNSFFFEITHYRLPPGLF